MDKHELSLTQDILRLVKTVRTISGFGHDPKMVLDEFEDFHYLKVKKWALKIETDEAQCKLANINQQH